MVIARKIAYNVAVSSVSKVLSTVLALVSIGLIARYLGKEGFGNYATALAFLSFFSAIADLGLYSVSTREISRPGADEKKIMGNVFTLRIVISTFVFLLAPAIVLFFPYTFQVKEAIIIIAASFLFSSAYQVLNGIFQKNLAMDRVALSEFLGKLLQVLVIFLAVKFNLGFLWVVSSLLFYMCFNFILVFFWSKKYIRFKLQFDFQYWKKFLIRAYPIGIVAFITFIYFKINIILLSVMKSSSDVGIFSAAYKVIENITFFPAMIVGLVFPIISNSIFSDKIRFREIADKTYKVFWVLIVPLIVGALALSDPIIALIGGAGFSESANVLRILIFALAFVFFGNFFNAILIAGNKQKRLMLVAVCAAVFNVLANILFIPAYSYTGVAIISVITEMIVVVGTCYFVTREIKYLPKIKNFSGVLGAGVAMAAALFIFKDINFLASGILSVAVYIIFLWIFRAVKTEEITSIISRGK
jgi:O-antigen/teichoic acid export membrane protein